MTPAVAAPGVARLHDWLARGYAGEMDYFAQRLAAYSDLNLVLEGVRSLLVLAMPYRTEEPAEVLPPGAGRVSRYAWGDDYHRTLWDRLEPLCALIRARVPGAKARGVTDSAPLMEREFAQLAGLGWIGKNTLLLNRELGSWFFLAVVVTDVELTADEPYSDEYCGTCRACLERVRRTRFVQPYLLDATKCLSYLTIEVRGEIPAEQRGVFTDWLWGCDICQEVCPWNNKAPRSDDPAWQPRRITRCLIWSNSLRGTRNGFAPSSATHRCGGPSGEGAPERSAAAWQSRGEDDRSGKKTTCHSRVCSMDSMTRRNLFETPAPGH